MSSRRIILLGISIVFLVCAALLWSKSEPIYQGRSLSSWLEQCANTPLMETNRLVEAQSAVRAIGARKALPKILKLVKTRDTPLRSWLCDRTERYQNGFLHWHSAIELQLQGMAGFEALGTNAAPAIGELTRLLDENEHAFDAVRCLDDIGKPAEHALRQCLTNRDSRVREWSAAALASVTDDVGDYLNRIKPLLNDADPGVRCAAVRAAGVQADAPELAVPLLIPVLADADDAVCSEAAGALSGFGTNAISAFPALTNLAGSIQQIRSRAALKGLAAIAPVQALPILSNAVVNGDSANLAATLGDLKSIAPELALQMSVTELHSMDILRRSQAVGVLGTYDAKTPGVAAALRSAASDSDPQIAQRAVMAMKQMMRRQQEQTGGNIEIPGEPSYQGKTLGEWLKMRRESWELETNAVTALQHMGTTVIPALLARLRYRDPAFGLFDYNVSMEAVGAFIGLREQAKPALPELQALMESDDRDLSLRSMIATLGMGTDAVPCLMKGLTNRFPDVRNEAVNYLAGEWGARYPELRQKVVPAVIRMLNDPDQEVRENAGSRLKELNSQAAVKTVK